MKLHTLVFRIIDFNVKVEHLLSGNQKSLHQFRVANSSVITNNTFLTTLELFSDLLRLIHVLCMQSCCGEKIDISSNFYVLMMRLQMKCGKHAISGGLFTAPYMR